MAGGSNSPVRLVELVIEHQGSAHDGLRTVEEVHLQKALGHRSDQRARRCR
jgi:hypothetical protein